MPLYCVVMLILTHNALWTKCLSLETTSYYHLVDMGDSGANANC